MKNKQAFFVNQMWNPFMLVELNIINGELPKYPINDPPPKKNKREWYWNRCGTGESYFDIGQTKERKHKSPTQHVNPPTDDRTMTWFNHYRVFKGEGEEWVKMMTEPQDGEGEE